MVRPSVDLPHPDSPTSPSVSPARTAKLTSSTAWTVRDRALHDPLADREVLLLTWANLERAEPRPTRPPWSRAVTAGCFRARRDRGVAVGALVSRRRSQQRSEMARGAHAVLERRLLLLALLERVRTAGRNLQPLRRVDQRRRHPLDRVQALDPWPVETWECEPRRPHVYGMLRVVEDVARRTALDDLTGVHDHDTLGDLGDHAEIVADEQDGDTRVGLDLTQHVEDMRLDRHVEGRRRLVGNQQRRFARQCHGDHHALAHAAAELVRVGRRVSAGSMCRPAEHRPPRGAGPCA